MSLSQTIYVRYALTRSTLSVNFYAAGQDATEVFYGLHRHEVLERPQYKLLQIGTIQGEEPEILGNVAGALSKVPYAEPTVCITPTRFSARKPDLIVLQWLADGYYSPYFREVIVTIFWVKRI